MDLHNVLIGGYYVYVAIVTAFYMIRGERTSTSFGILSGFAIIAGLVASIFATGDPSSWQAVFLMVWWAGTSIWSVTTIGKTTYFDEPFWALAFGYVFTLVVMIIPLFLIGINIPAGG